MHKFRQAKDPSIVGDLIRAALAGGQGALLMHRLDVALLVAKGRSVDEVADWFGIGRRSVQRWVHEAYLHGMDGLKEHRRDGRPPSLTLEQAMTTFRDLMSSPGAFGYPDRRWTGKRLALHLERCVGITISVRTCQRIIARSR